ncbi:MAG: retropepsin-like domain-containing protein [Planctomycetes bacterium]|nr:retropepsin-like domain-containing protein [Planctomycetota bacterium]
MSGPRVIAVRLLAVFALASGCRFAPVGPTRSEVLESVELWIHEGQIERADEAIERLRELHPDDYEVAYWHSVVAELLWQDDVAVRSQLAAIRRARVAGVAPPVEAALRGRLGDLLFQAGRWGEATADLEAGATTEAAERRRAFAAVSRLLPFRRKQAGPLLTEQPLLDSPIPEFVCSAGELNRPFAIDTGTSMTTLSREFAAELGVRGLLPAGSAVDSAGRAIAVEAGLLPRFAVGDVDLGNVPILVIEDAALMLRDLHGGPERVPRGVLGLDQLAAFRLTIDPERDSVVLELPRGLPALESVQCVRADGRCLLPVTADGTRLWFVLDTGASHSSLTVAGVDALPPGRRAVATFRRVRTVGGGLIAVREVRDIVLRVSEARFRGVALPVVPRGDDGGFPVHGVLGMDLLGRCRVTFDRGRARLLAYE